MRQSNQEIERKAAKWAARTDSEKLPHDAQAALDAWLAADIRHVGAYAKAMAVLARLERARAAGVQALRPEASAGPSRRQIVMMGSVAASLATFVGVGEFAWQIFVEDGYATRVGETQVVPLADGSIATLNTNSKIRVHYTKERRGIELLHGEALFDVAKNKNRPFVVQAGDTQVRAVGTSFTVRLLPEEPVQVLVREGVVEVKRSDVPVAAPVRVAANTRAVAPVNAPIATASVAEAELTRDLAWRVGRIAFDDETLADAARKFARYSNTRIVIDDPRIATRTVTGFFVANDPVGFARAVAVSLNLRADVADGEVRLSGG